MLQQVLKLVPPAPNECLTAGERVTENILNLYQMHPSYIEIGLFKVCVIGIRRTRFERTASCYKLR